MSEQIVVLSVKSQKSAGEKIFKLHKKRVVFGSSTSSDVCLEDSEVSPIHAILEVSGLDGSPVIYDLASDTGTKLNGKPIVQENLKTSDQIQVGPYLISVRLQAFSEIPQVPETIKESFGQKLFVSEKEDLASLLLEDESQVIDIFDHKPEQKQSLQVVMFYHDSILDVEHFVNKKRIVIGPGSKEDFCVPSFLRSGKKGRFELVTKEGDEYYLHLHENIKGMISQDGKATPVSAKTYPLGQKDFAKIQIQDVSFFLNFTPAPPKLKTYRLFERDPLFLKIWILSLVLTVFTIFSLSVIPVNPTIEIEQLPERLATIIYEPRFLSIEKPKAPPQQKIMEIAKPIPKVETPKVIKIEPKPVTSPAPPKPVIAEKPKQQTKTSQAKASAPKPPPKTSPKLAEKKHSSGQEGQGQKAKGPEGSRGQPKAPPANTPQLKAQRPGEAPKSASTGGSQTGRSEVKDLGVVDVFKSQEGTLSKLLAGGKEVTQAANKLEGYSGFTSQGEGGLGEAGAKAGGGGQSLGLGGLSDKGVGGGKKGAGLGALGSGGQILGGKGKLIIEGGGLPEPIVLGAIDTDAIAREIAKHRDEIKYCYEKEINAENPNLAGRVGIRFVIGASGAVSASGVSSSSLKNTNVEQCVVEVIRRIQFPPVRGGGIAEVTYPFLFKPATK